MSIVRIGLAETKHFSEGYESIFGKRKEKPAPKAKKATKKPKAAKKKPKK